MVKLSQQLIDQRLTRTERIEEQQTKPQVLGEKVVDLKQAEELRQAEELKKAETKLSYYQQKLATETDPDRRDKWIEYVNAWQQGVKHVQAGYTYDSVRSWATATASGEVAHALQREEETVIRLREEGFTEEQITLFKQTGEMPLKEKITITELPPEKITILTPKQKFYSALGFTEEKTDLFGMTYFEKPKVTPITSYAKVVQLKEEAVIEDYDRKWYEKSMEELFVAPTRKKVEAGAGFIWEKVKTGYEKIPSGQWSYGVGGITPYKRSVSIDLTAWIGKEQEFLGDVSEDIRTWAVGGEKIKELDLELAEKYQTQYQSTFESKYMKDIMYEATTFEQASKEFEKSEEAKFLQQTYQKEYDVKYKEISQSASLGKKLAGGSAIAVLGISKLGLGLIKTPKSAVLTAGAVYTGVGVLKLIPSHIAYTTTTGLFSYGTYKAFSPLSTVEEAGGGLVTAVVSGTFLGYGAMKYLKSPVIKTVKIKPKISAKTGKIIGYEQPKIVIKDIYGKTTIKEITKYPKTLSRQVLTGRRTIVTTKGRQFFRVDDLYKGVPTQQLGKTYTLKSLRGIYTYTTPSAYQKSLKLLKKYGYTEAQAKATLRYYSPKIIETEVSAINVLTYGEEIKPFAVSKTTVIRRQPIKIIDEKLGIKTRGAKTIKDIYLSEKSIIKELKGYSLIREVSEKTTGFLTDKGGWYNKLIQAGRTTTQYERTILAKVSDIKTGYAPKEISKYYVAGQEFKYQTLKEIFAQRQVVPLKYQRLFGKGKAQLIKSKDVIYIDESELTGIKARKILVPKKAPKIRPIEEMNAKQLKQMIKDLQNIYGKGSPVKKISRVAPPTKDVNKIIEKLERASDPSKLKTVYPQQLDQALKTDVLKQIRTPDIKAQKVKDLIKVKQVDSLGLKLAPLTSTKLLSILKTETKIKLDLKTLLKTDVLLKQKQVQVQVPALKQQSALKQALKLRLGIKTITPTFMPSLLETPLTPKIKPPAYRPVLIPPFFLKGRVEKKLLKKKKIGQEFAYLPDFTAKALGLDPEIITGKQAQARIKKILTGLEVRRGVIIK